MIKSHIWDRSSTVTFEIVWAQSSLEQSAKVSQVWDGHMGKESDHNLGDIQTQDQGCWTWIYLKTDILGYKHIMNISKNWYIRV